MYISINWLQKYLPTIKDYDIDTLKNKLSGALAEVEQIEERGKELKEIVVGEIKEVKDHPKVTSLAIAQVDTGDRIRQIIFAGANKHLVKEGTYYPVCLPGGRIYDSKKPFGDKSIIEIESKEIEGEVSEGVLCSPIELGVFDEKAGISIVSRQMKPGENLLGILQDTILEIENKSLTHRPDCFSHRGIAWEISAIMNVEFIDADSIPTPIKTGDKSIKVIVRDKDLCKRFCGLSIQNIEVKSSPAWMQILLSYIGLRPINNIVDISNYIMMDLGYPSHIYDLDKISGDTIYVRKAQKNEKVDTLNEKSYVLDSDMLVIADKNGVEDIAGIMGGANSEISDKTTNVFIEVASFDMYNIRRTSMKLGINTDASVRFSKGLDSFGQKEALFSITNLIEDLADGEVASELIDIQNLTFDDKYVEFDPKMISKFIGLEIDKREVVRIIESLNIQVEDKASIDAQISDQTVGSILKLKIPYYRKDLNIAQDIAEEVARIYGYENVVPKLPSKTIQGVSESEEISYIRKIRTHLLESGLNEIYSYTFVSEDLITKSLGNPKNNLKLLNPLSPELEFLRSEILPSHLDKIQLNLNHYNDFGYFEISKIITNSKTSEKIPEQPRKVSGILVSKDKKANIYGQLKSKLDYLLNKLNIVDVSFVNLNGTGGNNVANMFHPYKSAKIVIGKNKVIGHIGEIHPLVADNFNVSNVKVAAFDLIFDELVDNSVLDSFKYSPIVNNQIVHRDLNIWLKEKSEVGEILKTINNSKIDNLTETSIIDTYTTKEGRESITLHFKLEQNAENPLTDDNIKEVMNNITKVITTELKLELRTN